MRRRDFLAASGLVGTAGLAGCAGFQLESSSSVQEPALVEDRPDGVYYPTHVEGMKVVGKQTVGDYTCALTYSYPHRFWLFTGSHRQKVALKGEDSVHLMPVVWDSEAKIVPPDVNPQITVEQNGERVANVSPWPMLSQPMGVHFGDNVALPGDGTYQVSIRIGEPSVKRTGSLKDGEYGPATFEFEFDFSESKLNEIGFTDIPTEKEGTPGAVAPSKMMTVQMTQAPTKDALPGSVRATGTSDDAKLVVTTIDGAESYGGSADQTYLAVSARTPYNRFVIPAMALSGTLTRDGETVFDGQFDAALDSDLNYHYGTALSNVQSGDELEISVDAPSQTARHEGYETAFYQMDPVTLML